MGEKIVVGIPSDRGLKTDVLPFIVDNNSFPTLVNAYQWRGRVKRKRGTSLLGRLQRSGITATGVSTPSPISFNLFTFLSITQPNAAIVPGSISITLGPETYVDNGNGTLTGAPTGNAVVNYSNGNITITTAQGSGNPLTITLNYYPDLPVMGLEDFAPQFTNFAGTIAFDTKYSYNINTNAPYTITDVSYYKNPVANGTTMPGYVAKTTPTPTTWNGQDYQQFWTTNYQGAFWATNGINVPFSISNIGMQYKPIVAVTVTSGGPPAIVNLQITAHGLVVGDFLFINEVLTTTGINFQTGYVITVVDANNVTVEFPFAIIATNGTGGIAQYLTNRSSTTVDCIRWYDGDPTTLNSPLGWVNFAPPLSEDNYSIAGLPPAKYYLAGARMIVPFKDRLLFIGPVVQTSAAGSQVYLQDTIIYSQNGTAFYTASYTNKPNAAIDTPVSANIVFNPLLVPVNQTATSPAYFEDQTGFAGFLTAGVDEAITTSSSNEDVLILGFRTIQARLVYSGNDIIPFNLFLINSEYGSASTFSIVNMDRGVITRGSRGYIITSQTQCERVDLEIPDQVFQISLDNNGTERFTAQRDFLNEWVYFTYPSDQVTYKFPNQTLFFNYRDNTYALFNESYTTYGLFRRTSGLTWATLPSNWTWSSWNSPWNSGDSTLFQPEVIAGNQQGFVMFKDDESTEEGNSLYIQNISSSTVTAPDHCLNNGDYIIISGALGTVGTQVNGLIFSVTKATTNTFVLNPPIAGGTYIGAGVIKRMYVPFIQTKQFPVAWGMGRKTRLGPQQYLLTTTNNGQITLQIYLSQNNASPYNAGTIVPAFIPQYPENSGLIYSSLLYTCPESTNLGLTPANINLQMVTGISQQQIWHRMNTSLIGDTVQIGFTMNDAQMRDVAFKSQFTEIEIHGFILDVNPSQILA